MKKKKFIKFSILTAMAASAAFSYGFNAIPFGLGSSYVSQVEAADSFRSEFKSEKLYNVLKVLVNASNEGVDIYSVMATNPDTTDITSAYSKYLGAGYNELDEDSITTYAGKVNLRPYNLSNDDLAGLNKAVRVSEVDLPTSVNELQDGVFEEMSGLKTVKMSKNVKKIGVNTFKQCTALSKIYVYDGSNTETDGQLDLSNVSSIGNSAFLACRSFSVVKLSNSIKLLDSNSFQNCYSLSGTINLPNGVSLGTGVFSGCSSLGKITFANEITSIPNAFLSGINKSGGIEVSIASNSKIARIGNSAFRDTIIKSINIEATAGYLTEIDRSAFEGAVIASDFKFGSLTKLTDIGIAGFFNTYLYNTNITLPESLTDIGEAAFAGSNITSINIPDKVTTLNNGVFCYTALNNITIKNTSNLQVIGDYTFAVNGDIPNTNFLMNAKKLKTIGKYAFAYCIKQEIKDNAVVVALDDNGYIRGLDTVNLPNSVTTIGDYCFYDTASINTVSSLGSVTTVAPYSLALENIKTFPGWAAKITFAAADANNTEVSLVFGDGIKDSYKTNYPISEISQPMSVTLPAGLNEIGKNAFEYRERLQNVNSTTSGSVDLSGLNSLTSVGDYSFKNCSFYNGKDTNTDKIDGIKQLTVSKNLQTIGVQAFYQDYSLEKVLFSTGSSLTKIGKEAFAYCTPSKVATECGLRSLVNFDKLSNLETIGESAFNSNTYLKLDRTSSPFVCPASLKTIDKTAFYDCKYTDAIQFNSKLETIGASAFYILANKEGDYNEYGLAEMDFSIARNLTSVGNSAFANNIKLKHVEMNQTKLSKVSSGMFSGCLGLEDFAAPDKYLKAIDSEAFKNCSSLKSIIFPVDSTINKNAFGNPAIPLPKLNITLGTLKTGLKVPFGQKINFEANAFINSTSKSYYRKKGSDYIKLENDTEDYFKMGYANSKFSITGGADVKADATTVQILGTFVFGGRDTTASIDIPVTIVGVKAEDVIMLNDKQKNIILDVDNSNKEVAGNYKWVDGQKSDSPAKYIGYVKGNNISTDLDKPTLITLQANINPSTFTYGSGNQANNLKWEVASGSNVLEISGDAENTLPTDKNGVTSTGENVYFTSVQKVRIKSKGEATLRLVYSYKDYNSKTGEWDFKNSCINLVKINVVNPISKFNITLKETGKDSGIELIQGNTANIILDKTSIIYSDKESTSYNEPQNFIYYSDNPEVATVNNNGLIVAQNIYKNGYYDTSKKNACKIVVRTRTGSSSKTINVRIRPDKDSVVPNSLEIVGDDYLNVKGASKVFTVKNIPALSNENVDWSISGGAATAVQEGNSYKLTPVRTGNVTIKAVSKAGSVSVTKTIKIVSPTKNIKFMKTSGSTEVDSWLSFGFVSDTNAEKGIYRPKDNDDFVTFTVADTSVAKISTKNNDSNLSGKVVANSGTIYIKGIKEGKTIITATTESGGKAQFTINVAKKTLKSIKVKDKATVSAGSTFKLAVTKTPADSYEGWTFSSKDSSIATVDANGVVKGIKEGTVDIVVTTDIKKLNAICTVTVTKGKLKSGTKVTIGKINYVANKDGSVTFKSSPKASGNVVIPATIKTKVNGVTLTAKVTAIAPNAFKGNKKIKSVKMGVNVKTIGNNAFMNCTALTTVSMGKGVTTVGNSAFAGCKKLTKLTIGASVTKIGNNAFKGCVALTKVTIPKKVTTIGTQAFGGCKKLALVTIKAENLKKVGAKAFKSIKAGAKFKCGAKAEAYEKLLKKSGLPSKGKVIK